MIRRVCDPANLGYAFYAARFAEETRADRKRFSYSYRISRAPEDSLFGGHPIPHQIPEEFESVNHALETWLHTEARLKEVEKRSVWLREPDAPRMRPTIGLMQWQNLAERERLLQQQRQADKEFQHKLADYKEQLKAVEESNARMKETESQRSAERHILQSELKNAAKIIEEELAVAIPLPSLFVYRSGSRFEAYYRNALWSSTRRLSDDQWCDLVDAQLIREESKLAAASRYTAPKVPNGREHITEATRIEVWRRDGGQCTRCGGRERLEFDHIIPVTLGGSSTARNVQLLCEECNRRKGVSLA